MNEHEKGHNLAKYGKMCRVEGCGQLCLDTSKRLTHERRCIRKALANGGSVDEKVLEDVRRRSQHLDLGWPEEKDGQGNSMEEEETEVDGNENNEEGTIEHLQDVVPMGKATQFVNNEDPLEGVGNFDNL